MKHGLKGWATFVCLFALLVTSAHGQSKTTEKLHRQYGDALALFFYNNTLRMINQEENKEFDEMIKDIEKMKFLMIEKKNFTAASYNTLVKDYKAEAFEEIMTSRIEGRNFDVFLKQKDGINKGIVVAVNDQENLYILDIVGSIALNRVGEFFKTIDQSSEVGKRIKEFTVKENE